MPILSPSMIKILILLLGTLVVASPIHHINNSNIIVNELTDTHYLVEIPIQDGKINLYINRNGYNWGYEQIVPIEGINIINKKNEVVEEFDILNEPNNNDEQVRGDFAEFLKKLPKTQWDTLRPWVEKAVTDYDGLLNELEKMKNSQTR